MGSMIGKALSRFAAVALASLLAACALPSDFETSASFDSASDKAIVILATRHNWFEGHRRHAHTLTTYWREYDPKTMRLVPDGKSFWTAANNRMQSSSDYDRTSVKVMEVEPGSYALVGAGYPEKKSLFVRLENGEDQITVRDSYLDPLKYIDPSAPVNPRYNFLFSAQAGQVLYVGHFEFVRPHPYTNLIVRVNYTQDVEKVRETLRNYPGIAADLTTLDLSSRSEQAAR